MTGLEGRGKPLPAMKPPAAIHALGPPGTFSDQAAHLVRTALLSSAGETSAVATPPIRYTHTIPEVLVAVEQTSTTAPGWGVIPIENSVAGIVGQAQDGLLRHDVHIFGEVAVRVRFSLLTRGSLEQIECFYAHPQAYDQCSEFLAQHLPQAEVIFTRSNVEAGELFLTPPKAHVAAIVPIDYGATHAQQHPEQVLAQDIQTYEHNTTRFLAVGPGATPDPPDLTRAKTSICIDPDTDRPGLLFELLRSFYTHDLNIHRLESRPAKIKPWTYVFFIDFTNNAKAGACLAEIRQSPNKIRVLGTYDALA